MVCYYAKGILVIFSATLPHILLHKPLSILIVFVVAFTIILQYHRFVAYLPVSWLEMCRIHVGEFPCGRSSLSPLIKGWIGNHPILAAFKPTFHRVYIQSMHRVRNRTAQQTSSHIDSVSTASLSIRNTPFLPTICMFMATPYTFVEYLLHRDQPIHYMD